MEGIKKNPSAGSTTYVKKNNDYRVINEKQISNPSGINHQDKIRLSSESRSVQEASQQLKKMRDIRPHKVNELKNLVRNGEYLVDSKKVAYQMIIENIWDYEK